MKNSNDIESVFDIRLKQERNGLVYLPNETTPFTGVFVGWYENGTKRAESHYIDGKENGLSTLWHRNGQKKSERNYKDGKEDGTHTWWHWNGQKKSEGNYKDGKKDGTHTSWYDNGQKSSEGNYKDGKKVGQWTGVYSDKGFRRIKRYPFPRYNDVEGGYYIRGKRVKWYFVIFVVLIIYFLT